MLSKKRKVPRIVKKRKRTDQKVKRKIKPGEMAMTASDQWNGDKTAK